MKECIQCHVVNLHTYHYLTVPAYLPLPHCSYTHLSYSEMPLRNGLARNVAWHAGSGQLRSSSAISFDGRGYLFTEQFGTVADFSTGATFQTIMLFLRPNDASRGLAMYAYQPQVLNTESCDCHMIDM